MAQPVETLTLEQESVLRQYIGFSPGKNKFDATSPPSLTDDSASGYAVGSVWFDVTGQNCYSCVSAAVGAAVWAGLVTDPVSLDALEFGGTDPNVPGVKLTGISSPVLGVSDFILRYFDDNAYGRRYSGTVTHSGNEYAGSLDKTATGWRLEVRENFGGFALLYVATKASPADSPIGLTGWAVSPGTGSPTLASQGVSLNGTFMGQWCYAGAAPHTWWQWNGINWLLGIRGSDEGFTATIRNDLRDFDANTATVDNLFDVVATLLAILKSKKVI